MATRQESGKPDPPQEREQESPLLLALPPDILRRIIEQLDLVDRIRFRAVCKDLLLAPIHDLRPIHELPWIMDYQFTITTSLCLLFEPFRGLPYVTEDKNFVPGQSGLPPGKSNLLRAKVCASRSGWVLFTKTKDYFLERAVKETAGNVSVTSDLIMCVTSYFVYNVLTKTITTLPDLKVPALSRLNPPKHHTYSDDLATFSSVPTSPHCVFFVSHPSISDEIVFSTYSIGDESWKTHTFTCPQAWRYSAESVVYMEGSFYCFSRWGLLASFSIATQEWTPLMSIAWDVPLERGRSYFLEYGGRLIIVVMKTGLEVSRPECDIFRFDWLDRVWMKVESLEGGAIFLGKPCFGVSAGEKTKMVANRVYYLSMNTTRFITYGPVSPGIGSECEERMVYPDTWDRDSLYWYRIWIWIDPPLLQPWQG